MKQKPLKSYVFKLFTDDALELFEKFQSLVVYRNTTPTQEILEMIDEYVRKQYPIGKTLVSESVLIENFKSKGWTTGRSSLKKYRDKDLLKDKTGPFWWTNEDGNVIYDLDKVMAFVQTKQK